MMTTKTDDELRKETLDSSEAMEDDARYKTRLMSQNDWFLQQRRPEAVHPSDIESAERKALDRIGEQIFVTRRLKPVSWGEVLDPKASTKDVVLSLHMMSVTEATNLGQDLHDSDKAEISKLKTQLGDARDDLAAVTLLHRLINPPVRLQSVSLEPLGHGADFS